MKEFIRSALLIWRYGVQYRGKAMTLNDWRTLATWMVIIYAYNYFANYSDPIFYALCLPSFFCVHSMWGNYCSGAAALIRPRDAHLAPQIRHHARHIILLVWLLLATAGALFIAQRFGSFWRHFFCLGAILLMQAYQDLCTLPRWTRGMSFAGGIWLYLAQPFSQIDAVLPLLLLILGLACIGLYRTMLRPENAASANSPNQPAGMPRARTQLLQRVFAKPAPETPFSNLVWAGSFSRGSIRIGALSMSPTFLLLLLGGWATKLLYPDALNNNQNLLGQIVCIVLALMQLSGRNPFLFTIERTKPEQSLFRLSPLAPASEHFNWMLARHFVRTGMINWLYVTLLFMLYSALFGASSQILLAQFAACSIGLHKIATPLCNYASLLNKLEHRPIEENIDGLMLISMCFILVLISWYVLGSITPPPEWAQHFLIWWSASLLLINVIHTARILPRRWRMMVAAPVAFPAGRLDD